MGQVEALFGQKPNFWHGTHPELVHLLQRLYSRHRYAKETPGKLSTIYPAKQKVPRPFSRVHIVARSDLLIPFEMGNSVRAQPLRENPELLGR